MFTFFEILILLLCLLLGASVLYYITKPRNLPPGPLGLPFVGALPYLTPSTAFLTLTEWSKQYGPIMSFYMGSRPIVVLADANAVKEAFVKQDHFNGRPKQTLPRFMQISPGAEDSFRMGLIHCDGELWKEQRRFALTTLRDFGFGKPIMESNIADELGYICDTFDKEANKPFDPQILLNNAVSNVICSLVFGRRFDYNDTRFKKMIEHMNIFLAVGGQNILSYHHYFPIMALMTNYYQNQRSLTEILDFVKDQVVDVRANYNPDEEPTNYITAFLKAQAEGQGQYFSDRQLAVSIIHLFVAGTETTATTLRWALIYMGRHPDIQERVHNEVKSLCGAGNFPTWANRGKLPYTEAVINEIQRMSNLAPTGVPHRCTKDTELLGYHIPKDTFVLPLLWAVHYDDAAWEQSAGEFKPERFLQADGATPRKHESFMPFSTGKRVCLGESLAKMELFFFFTGMMARYRFHFDGIRTPEKEDFYAGVVHSPKPYKIIVEPRF